MSGESPVTETVGESILAKDIDGLEQKLTRHGYKGTLNNQSFAIHRYSQKFILRQSEERDVEISNIALLNFLLCLENERNTRLFKAPIM